MWYELWFNPSSLIKNSVHPQTPAEGASTAIYAAAASELEGIGRLYLYNGRKTESSAISYDEQLQARLWKESCALVGLHKAWKNIKPALSFWLDYLWSASAAQWNLGLIPQFI